MSTEPYTVDGVTVTSKGGGVYELTHPKLSEPVIERGKDKADIRAAEIAKGFQGSGDEDDGTMEKPGQLDPNAAPATPAAPPNTSAPAPAPAPAPTPPAPAPAAEAPAEPAKAETGGVTVTPEMFQQLLDQLKIANERLAGVGAAAEEAAAPTNVVPAAVPRKYAGTMDAETRRLMEKMGVGVTTIILEENESIPPTGLYLGHNYRGYVIVPGAPVDVPDFLINVLNHAVMAAPIVDPQTTKVLGYRNRLRYGYRTVTDKG